MSKAGNAMIHDTTQAPHQCTMKSGLRPSVCQVEMPDTIHVIRTERTSGMTTSCNDAGSFLNLKALEPAFGISSPD